MTEVFETALVEPSMFTNMTQIVVFGTAWMAIGAVCALLLRIRGHELGPNLALGVVLGPLFACLALATSRFRETPGIWVVDPGAERTGLAATILVLGEPESTAEARPILQSLGSSLGTVTVAVPITIEDYARRRNGSRPDDAAARLSAAALMLGDWSPRQILLPGSTREWTRLIEGDSTDSLLIVTGRRRSRSLIRMASSIDRPIVSLP